MKNILFLFKLILYSTLSFGQETPEVLAKEAMQAYESSKDSDVFKCMIALEGAIQNYLYFDAKKAHSALQFATVMADTSEVEVVRAMSFYLSGTVEKSTGDLDKAIKLFEQAEVIFQKENLYKNTPGDHDFTASKINRYKVHMKKELGDSYRLLGEITTAQEYFKDYLELAIRDKNDDAICAAYNYLGICSDLNGDYHSGIKYYNKAIEHGELIDYPDSYITYGNMAISYYNLGERRKSLENLLIMADGAERIGNKLHQANAYGNIRLILTEIEDYEAFFDYGEKVEKVYIETENKWFLARLYNSNALTYLKLDSLGMAMEMVEKSLALSRQNNLLDSECASFRIKGKILHAKKKYKEAEKWLAQALEIGESHGLEDCLFASQSLLGSNYVLQNLPRKAIDILTPSLNKYEVDGDIASTYLVKKDISKAYASIGNYNKAYHLLADCRILSDSLNDLSKVSEMARTESDYQYEKEKEIIDLENQKQQEVLLAQANTNRAIAFGIGALGLLGFWFFYNARRKNKTIAQKNEQLETLNHTKDQIFSIIGHDLRKPAVAFSNISESINYLIQKEDYGTLKKMGVEIERDGFALQKLTDNLLNWALSQRDVLPFNPLDFNLKQKTDEVITVFRRAAKEKDLELVNEITNDTEIHADPNATFTILMNLLDNAIKFTPRGGQIRITSSEHNNKVQLNVSDTGIGMNQEELSDIFALAKGKSSAGTDGESGTGLGLHLVHELVKMNKGEIRGESTLGEGTTFRVSLPK